MGPQVAPAGARRPLELRVARRTRARHRRRRIPGTQPMAVLRSDAAGLDGVRHLRAGDPDRRGHALGVGRAGGGIQARRLRPRRSRIRRVRLAGLCGEQRRWPRPADADSAGSGFRHGAVAVRHHRLDRLLRAARHRRAEAGGDRRGFRRGGIDGLLRGADRQDQGRAGDRYRRRRQEMRLAHG